MSSYSAANFFAQLQIAAFLDAGLDANLKGVLQEKKEGDPFRTQAPIQALDELLRSGNASPSTVILLQFVKSLWNYCGDAAGAADPELGGPAAVAPAVCGWVLAQLTPSKPNELMDQLIELLFPRAELDRLIDPKITPESTSASKPQPPKELSAAVLSRLRLDVFNAEPLRTINRLVAQGKFAKSLPESMATAVQAIVSTMTQEALEIGSPDLLARVALRIETTQQELSDALEAVQSLKVLARIAEDPEDVPIIYGKRYRTIREITQSDKDSWIPQMVKEGMTKDNALKAYDCAERIDCWNENLWLTLMQSRHSKYTPIAAREIKQMSDVDEDEDDDRPARAGNNLTDIFQLEDIACETCCSVTSLSAYFADLLSPLRSTPCRTTNLLEILRRRRPDLTKLQLTCANAQTLVPYVSLVNEVLESFIMANTADKSTAIAYDSVRAFNTPDNGTHNHSDTAVYRPGNTIPAVYTVISRQMFPFADFPYNQARDAVAQYFNTFCVTMLDLVTTFQAPELVSCNVPKSLRTAVDEDADTQRRRIDAGVRETLERHRAAETLGLQLADFVAITGEAFYPAWLAELLMGLSNGGLEIDKGCSWTAADLWGYDAATIRASMQAEADKATASIKEVITLDMATAAAKNALLHPEKGLSRIKKQLMRRSGLTFQNIMDLVKTQCFGQHLVITNATGSDEFTNSIEELRLLSSAAEPPFRPLTEELAFALQSFMRVQAKLGWSTKQLDAAVVCLRNLEMATSPHTMRTSTIAIGHSQELVSITPFVLKGLAAVITLSRLSGIEPAALQPLWGPIDTFGENSLMHRKFLTPAAAEVDKLFASPVAQPGSNSKLGDYFKRRTGPKAKQLAALPLGLHRTGICVSLEWPAEFFDDLLAASGQQGKDLDVTSFSALYRHILLCRILDVPPSECDVFFELFFAAGGRDALSNPVSTLAMMQQWKTLFAAGWTVSSLSAVLAPSSASAEVAGLSTAAAILEGAQNIRKSVPFVSAGGGRAAGGSEVATALNVADCAARTFDSATAALVTEFVEGTKVQVERITIAQPAHLDSLITAATDFPFKITLTPEIGLRDTSSVELQLTGILSAGELEKVQSLAVKGLPEGTNTAIKEALLKMADQAVEVHDKITTRFGNDKFAASLLSQPWPEITADSKEPKDEGALLAEIELQVRDRRRAFIELAGPTVIQDLLEAFILNVIKELVPDLDVTLVAAIISRIVRVASLDNTTTESAMAAMKALSEATASPVDLPLDAYFLPNSTDVFTLHYTGEEPKAAEGPPRLTVNGIPLSYDSRSKSFMSTRMRGGQAYLLTASFPASQLQWSTPKLLPAPMTDKMLLPSAITRRASEINAAILRVATVCRVFSLTAEELGFFAGALQAQQAQGTRQQSEASRMLAIDLNAPSLKNLIQLHKYCDLRRNISPPTTESQGSPLLTMLSWLSTTASATMDDLVSNLATGTGWNKIRVLAALEAKYADGAERDTGTVLAALRNIDALYNLYTVMQLDNKLGQATGGLASQPSMATLFHLAQPPKLLAADNSSTARSLQTRLMPDQRAESDSRLMENQRRALVAYLLQQQYVRKDLRVWDADGLFEHFLIDVQMGPQLCTSRIKQAISVVQLFVQRCLLGLEPDVPKVCLVRAKWDWMQQYSLWEAQRKLFLYPENWLDPSLRDDKSTMFEKFEASLMQKNLSIPTFVESIRAYIAGLNEISSLDVVAYAHEATKGVADTFHLFGRTRAAPHTFYYRTVVVQWPSGARLWRPWSKIDIDIPSVESDWNGSRLSSSGAYLLPVLAGGNRLYLFLPHVMPRTLDRKDESRKDNSFEDLRKTKIQDMAPRRIWEITMAWTELANGNWSPKRMSPGSVTVESETMPAATDFRVDTIHNSTTGSLTLLLSYTSTTDGRATVVGYFVFRADQISAVDSSAADKMPAPDRKVRTSFQQITVDVKTSSPESQYTKLSLPFGKAQSDEAWQNSTNMLVWVPAALDTLNRKAIGDTIELPQGQEPSEKLTWTLAMDPKESRLTGLALSASRSDGTSRSYFQVPKAEMSSMWWTASNMHNFMDSVVMDHVSAPDLMQAAVDQTNPLQSIFNLIASSASSYGLESFGAYGKKLCHELGQPSALYNWEIGLHAVMLAMDRFHATQQFDEALQVARLVFDPTIDVEVKRLVKQVTTTGPDGKEAVTSEVVVSPLAASASALSSADTTKVTLEARKQSVGSAWRFPPFQDIARRIAADGKKGTMGAGFDANRELEAAILERRSHGALVHATARGRPEAYMKWIVMKYVEILVASGDVHFRKGTLESLPLATQRYIEATHVLGPEPPQVTRFGDRKSVGRESTFEDLSRGREPWTFERLYQEDMRFGIRLPFSPKLELVKGAAAKGDRDTGKENIVGFLLTPYFGVPLNPKFRQIRSVIKQRLFNVRNSLDIDGRPITYALTEPSIDPGALVALSAAGFDSASASAMVMGDRDSPLPRQRFDILIHRALELCGEVRALGERLVSAIEKKETEAFGVLRAKHATAIQRMMYGIKETHMTEAQQTIDSLRLNRESVASQLAYYLALLGESESLIPNEKGAWSDLKQDICKPTRDDLRMSQHEKLEMVLADWAMGLNVVSASIDAMVAPLCMVPSVSINAMPMGMGTTVAAGGGSNFASFMQAGSSALKMSAMVVAEQGSQAARKAQLTRQLQDRRLQANMRGREIKSIDMQIEIQRTRVRTAQQELQLQESEVQESVQVETWLRGKYTNEALYSWVEKSLRSLYFQAYTLAMSTARSAESALAFENGRKLSILRPGGYWDASRDGLLAADHLYLDLKRLEAAHREGRRHDYEISKTISLRQVDPMALMRLRISGSTTFSLSEMLFDMDFPGHYMRRIRSVAVSIPAVLSAHSGVNATLTLQQHKYRVLQTAATTDEYAASWSSMSASNDEAFRTDRVPISAVAISSGTHDAGVFELNFAGDRYLPFEGAGVVSSWRLDLPTEVPRFDYNSIADVQLHVQYTSLEGGASLRAAANGAVRKALDTIDNSGTGRDNGFWAMWNLKNDFVNEWYEFSGQLAAAREDKSAGAGEREITMTMGDLSERLPFWARGRGQLEVRGITLVSKSVGLVDAMSVSVVPGQWDSKSIVDWRVRSFQKLQAANWKGWEFKVKAGSLKAEDKVGDVYMLVRYGRKS